MNLIECPGCSKDVSSEAAACPGCGQPIDKYIKCPKCRSKNVKTITGASKVLSIAMLGPFAANRVLSSYVCLEWNCRHKFNHAGSGVVSPIPSFAERIAAQAAAMKEQDPSVTPGHNVETIILAAFFGGIGLFAILVHFFA